MIAGDLVVGNNSGVGGYVTVGRISSNGSDNTVFNVQNRVGSSVLYVDSGVGNVGIGTTTPVAKLNVEGTLAAYSLVVTTTDTGRTAAGIRINSDGSGSFHARDGSGNLIGALDANLLTVASNGVLAFSSSTSNLNTLDTQISRLSGGKLSIDTGTIGNSAGTLIAGNGGIGTTTPWRTLSVTGTVGFDGLTSSTGAGSLCLDGNKQVVYNSASDNCLSSTRGTKHAIEGFSLDGLMIIDALQPVSFVYNEGDGRVRYGFIAEDTAAVDAHLATYNASGTVSGIDDRSILAVLVGALKGLWSKVAALLQSDEAQNARIQQLEEEVAALKSQTRAASVPPGDHGGTPANSSEEGDGDTVPVATSTSSLDSSATEEVISPANDNEPALDAAANEVVTENAQEAVVLEASNDNHPADLPATDAQ